MVQGRKERKGDGDGDEDGGDSRKVGPRPVCSMRSSKLPVSVQVGGDRLAEFLVGNSSILECAKNQHMPSMLVDSHLWKGSFMCRVHDLGTHLLGKHCGIQWA